MASDAGLHIEAQLRRSDHDVKYCVQVGEMMGVIYARSPPTKTIFYMTQQSPVPIDIQLAGGGDSELLEKIGESFPSPGLDLELKTEIPGH